MDDSWTPERIRTLREKLGMTQTQFGLELWDTNPATAQKNVSEIENDRMAPSGAVKRTLQRLEEVAEGEHPFEYLRALKETYVFTEREMGRMEKGVTGEPKG